MKLKQILFILFTLFVTPHSLFAKDALHILVEGGEVFENRKDYYIPSRSPVYSVVISPDGKSIISGSYDNSIKIWNRETGALEQILEGHTKEVSSVAISKDGKSIISASWDKSIKIWNRERGTLEQSLEGHTSEVRSVVISRDGKSIISGSDDNSIKIWNRETGILEQSLEGHTSEVISVVISRDGKSIISGSWDNSIKIWNRETGILEQSLEGHTSSVRSVAISRDGKSIISGSHDNSIKIWNRETGTLEQSLEGHTDHVLFVTISRDGKSIISGSDDNSIKIWNRETGALEKSLEGDTGSVYSIAISRDGKSIISGSGDNSIKIWNRETGAVEQRLEGHTSAVRSVAISSDGKSIISGSSDNSIKIWNRETGILEQSLEGHTSQVISVAISRDGKSIISGSWDKGVKVWDIKSKKVIEEFVGGVNGCWAIFDYEKEKLYRGDDGTLLYEKNGSKLTLALPRLPKKDAVVPLNNETNISTVNEKIYPYTLSIKNKADKKLYWLKTEYHDKYCTLLEQRISNLEAKAEQNLTLNFNCSLPRDNPTPIKNHKINLVFETATKSKFTLPLSVSIRYAELNVSKAEVSEDGKILNIEVQNIGNEKLVNAKVQLLEPFKDDIKELSNLRVNEKRVIPFNIADKNISRSLALNIYIPNEEHKNAVPLYSWHLGQGVTIVLNKMAWYIYALIALGIAILLRLLWKHKRYKHPLVLMLSKNPKELITLPLEQLAEAKERLSKIDRFENTLTQNSISQERYDRAIAFTNMTQNKKSHYLSKRVFAKVNKEGTLLTLKDDFSLNVKQFILFLSDKESLDDMMVDIKEIAQYRTHIVLVLSNSSEKQLQIYEQRNKHEKIVVPHPHELNQLLLASDGSKVLADIFASQLALTQISPYQLGGGVKASMFFGRAEIVSHILGRENSNYIVIGSRQIGKSSLLKAIEREYKKSNDDVYYISLGAGDLVRGMSKALNLKSKTLDELVSYLVKESKPYFFLIDEADRFVSHEKEKDYVTLNALRKLSEEGKANFIIAGFWELYQHAVLDYQSPLKNFGEIVELGALEKEACETMMLKPMSQLGLEMKQEAIDEIIVQVGQRANLIAIVCQNIIKNLGKTKKVIGLEEAKKALQEKNVYDFFESWRELNDDKKANRLDRIIVYLTVEEENFSLKNLLEILNEKGLRVDIADVEKSLDRLKVSYLIERNEEGKYVYMVALFREYILKREYKVKLEGEIREFRDINQHF